jgi:hypothetical protein
MNALFYPPSGYQEISHFELKLPEFPSRLNYVVQRTMSSLFPPAAGGENLIFIKHYINSTFIFRKTGNFHGKDIVMTEKTSGKKGDTLKKEMDELSASAKELQSTLSLLGKKIKTLADDDVKKL